MKVMCINCYQSIGSKDKWAIDEMYIGRELLVINDSGWYYEFEEYHDIFWFKKNFAPLSEIDEMELINENTLIHTLSKL